MGSEEAKEQVRSDRVEERSMAELRSQVAGQRHRTLEEIHDILRTKLGRERAVALERREGAVAVDLQGKVLFELGSAELTTRAAYILRDIARTLSGLPYHVTVEGHTDNIPIRTDRFPSNWELSAARAAAVARYLLDWGLDPGRMKVVGLADTRPLAPNVDERGRPLPENQVRNRRVVILVHP
jgi:chemotaxis protein MotB